MAPVWETEKITMKSDTNTLHRGGCDPKLPPYGKPKKATPGKKSKHANVGANSTRRLKQLVKQRLGGWVQPGGRRSDALSLTTFTIYCKNHGSRGVRCKRPQRGERFKSPLFDDPHDLWQKPRVEGGQV